MKTKLILSLLMYFFISNVYSFEIKNIKKKFKVNPLTIDLSREGEWKLINHKHMNVYNAPFDTYYLIKLKNNQLSEIIEIFRAYGAPGYPTESNAFFYNMLYNANKKGGCRNQSKYFLFELYKSGNIGNCFFTTNWSPQKGIYSPEYYQTDYTNMNYSDDVYQKAFLNLEIKLPKMMLRSESYYYDNNSGGRLFIIKRSINPEINGGPPTKFEMETQSKYHVNNLEQNKANRNYLQEWSNNQIELHIKFEEELKITRKRRLNFTQ
tara:strand:+ start:260 stop:1054 length:795 start_codon:yes stop_codon:yes gene_type:complete